MYICIFAYQSITVYYMIVMQIKLNSKVHISLRINNFNNNYYAIIVTINSMHNKTSMHCYNALNYYYNFVIYEC